MGLVPRPVTRRISLVVSRDRLSLIPASNRLVIYTPPGRHAIGPQLPVPVAPFHGTDIGFDRLFVELRV